MGNARSFPAPPPPPGAICRCPRARSPSEDALLVEVRALSRKQVPYLVRPTHFPVSANCSGECPGASVGGRRGGRESPRGHEPGRGLRSNVSRVLWPGTVRLPSKMVAELRGLANQWVRVLPEELPIAFALASSFEMGVFRKNPNPLVR